MSSNARRASATMAKETQQSFFEALYASRDADAQEITDGINLGAHAAAKDKKAMQRRKISHVLICHPALPETHPGAFKYGRAPLLDDPEANLLELIPNAMAFLGEARAGGGKVFICCAKGISRSSSMVISLLMLEQNISFEEAFSICEKRRPIVYPNIGFQQQLRHLETLMKGMDAKDPFLERVKALKALVPRGSLSGPSSPLQIRDRIGENMGEVLKELEGLADKVTSMPHLLQQRELWKRHGLFFENLHKYKTLPNNVEQIVHARSAAKTLKSLPKIFSDSLKGVQLALAVAKELDGWAAFAEPVLKNPLLNPKAELDKIQALISAKLDRADDDEDPMKDYCDDSGKSNKEKKERDSKKDKKDKKAEKKTEKADKKAAKAAQKVEKALVKMEKAAKRAEMIASANREKAELCGKRSDELAKEIAVLEAEEVFEARSAAAARRADHESAASKRARERPPSSGSSDGSGSAPKKRR